jgi:S-adenosylmethionine hydrolase
VRFGGEDLAEVIYVDHYGNCFTGIRARGVLETSRLVAGAREFAHARVFADAEPGTPFWYENSSGLIEIAVNRGSVARDLGLAVGMPVAWAA